MATTADFRNGLCIEFNNDLYTIVEFQHVKPGKGGAFVRSKLKSLTKGKVIENTFPSTQFDINISATIPTIDVVSGTLYTSSTAGVTRTPAVGNSNKTVLQDVAFSTVTGTVGSVVSRGLKQFIVQSGTPNFWAFHSNLTSTVI
jgi:hypothetical protein